MSVSRASTGTISGPHLSPLPPHQGLVDGHFLAYRGASFALRLVQLGHLHRMPDIDPNGVEALPGESEAEYVARQTRLREEAAARMRAKFGASGGLGGGMRMGGVASGGAGANTSGGILAAAAP